jgi:hypothetical protein
LNGHAKIANAGAPSIVHKICDSEVDEFVNQFPAVGTELNMLVVTESCANAQIGAPSNSVG